MKSKKAGIMESNMGRAILASIIIAVVLFILFLAKGKLFSIFETIKNLVR